MFNTGKRENKKQSNTAPSTEVRGLYPTPKPVWELGPKLAKPKRMNIPSLITHGLAIGVMFASINTLFSLYLNKLPTDTGELGMLSIAFIIGLIFLGGIVTFLYLRIGAGLMNFLVHSRLIYNLTLAVSIMGLLTIRSVVFGTELYAQDILLQKCLYAAGILIALSTISLLIITPLLEKRRWMKR